MVDLKVLEEFGVSAESWKQYLSIPADEDFSGAKGEIPIPDTQDLRTRRARMRERIRSRVNWGRDYNIKNWTHYYVLDKIWDAPYRQITPTLVASMMENCKTNEQALDALKSFNMDVTQFLVDTQETDAKTGQTKKILSVPAFFNVCVPLVRAYLTIRRAKLINDRNMDPMLKYQAAANTPENRLRSEVITDRISVMTKQFDHFETLNQAVFQMLLYGRCIAFPREEWYVEEQLHFTSKEMRMTKSKANGEFDAADNRIKNKSKVVVKEGIRHFIPHPTRCYYDQAYSPKTLNTDTGCTFAGYWKVLRFRELKKFDGFYNLDKISIGTLDWWKNATYFFNALMNQCVIRAPQTLNMGSTNDRQTEMANEQYYTSDYDDNSVILYEHYEKLIPKDDGLGDYPYPIWARFVVAGDGTIVYGTPVPYAPCLVCEDNGDANRIEDASMANQLVPFQDQLTNLLTQYLLSVKQNLTNLTLVDANVVEHGALEKIKNLGERYFRALNIFTFDGKKLFRQQNSTEKAVISHRFPFMDTNGILQAIRTLLDLAERVLQFSSQEVAQAATHEQTKREVEMIANTTSNILAYTGLPVDSFMEAMGRQNYYGVMNYGEDDFFVSVPNEVKLTKQKMEDMGFVVLEEPKKPGERFTIRVKKKTSAMLYTFAVTPPLHERFVDFQAAQAMATFMRDLLANPITGPAIGAEQALTIANTIAKLAGLQLPSPLRAVAGTPQQQAEQSREMLVQVINEVMRETKKGIQPIMELAKSNELKIDALYEALGLPEPNAQNQPTTGNRPENQGGQRVVATS